MFNLPEDAKRFRLLAIYEIFLQHEEGLKRKEICEILFDRYFIDISEKALTDILRAMTEIGLIEGKVSYLRASSKNAKEKQAVYTDYKLKHRPIEKAQLTWLIDTVLASKHLSEGAADELIKQLLKLAPVNYQEEVARAQRARHGFTNEDDVFFDNVYNVRNKIKAGATISFKMAVYVAGNRPQLQLSEEIVAKPLEMVMIDGEYYMIAYVPAIDSLQHYRVNRMRDIEKEADVTVDDARLDWKTIDAYRWDHGLMRDDKEEMATVRVSVQHMDLVMDRFRDVMFPRDWNDGDSVKLQFKVNPVELYMWAIENSGSVEVLEPQHVRNRLRQVAQAIYAQYLKNDPDRYYDALERAAKGFKQQYRFGCPDFDLTVYSEWLELDFITEVYIENNCVRDLMIFTKFQNLRKLHIVNERVVDLQPLVQLPGLRSLALCETLVEDISVLSGLDLRWLKLVDNYNIQDFSVLYEMDSLRTLWLDEETVNSIDVEKLKTQNPRLLICYEHETQGTIRL